MQIISNKSWNELTSKLSNLEDLKVQVKSLQSQSIISSYINYNTAIYPDWGIFKELETYRIYDDVYSVISLLSQTASLVPFYNYEIVDDNSMKSYQKTTGIQKKYFQLKALEDLNEDDFVYKSMENPHETLSKFEFFEALYTYLFLGGEVFLYKETLDYGVNKGVTKFHFLMAQNVTVFITEKFPQRVTGYRYVIAGETIDFKADEVIHIKYFDPLWCNGSQWRGFSPLRAMAKRLTRMDAEMNVSVAQLQNGGVPGIAFEKDGDFDTVEKNGVRKERFNKFLSSTENKGAPYFAAGEMGYIQIGSVLADLKVEELANIDLKKLCNAYHASVILFNDNSASTENNVKYARRSLYTNSILPNIYRVRDAFYNGYISKYTDKKRFIDSDISGVSELQDDMKLQSDALDTMWWIAPNEKRAIQKFDKSEDPLMDKIYIKSGYQPIEDIGMIPDLPNPAKDYNA